MTALHYPADPEPPIGTILRVGGPADHITFTRGVDGWTQARNGDRATACTYRLVVWWAPLRYTTRTYRPLTEAGRYRPIRDVA